MSPQIELAGKTLGIVGFGHGRQAHPDDRLIGCANGADEGTGACFVDIGPFRRQGLERLAVEFQSLAVVDTNDHDGDVETVLGRLLERRLVPVEEIRASEAR